ncbi:MAG: hypothetical protein ACP5NP_17270 [Acetobacteraceae bacterium]
MHLHEVSRWVLTGIGILMLCVAGFGAIWKRHLVLVTIPAMGCLIAANIGSISSFKISPSVVEAKMQTLTATVVDARRTLRQIQQLAVLTAKSLIQLREGSNALLVDDAGDEFQEQDQFKEKIVNALKGMDLPPAQIRAVENSDRQIVLSFYANAIYRFGLSQLPRGEAGKFEKDWEMLLTSARPTAPSPDQCVKLLEKYHIDSDSFSPYIRDYSYYRKTGDQRRPDVWARREQWGFGGQ